MALTITLTIALLLLLSGTSHLNAQSKSPYFQQRVDYSIDVTLHDKDRTLDGSITLQYHNQSPDTLHYIWFHVWPNAYKNDGTAFSEQLLENGRTDFYFSTPEQRGYINHLNFRVDGVVAAMEDHPLYIDIIKVILPTPLPPGGQVTITTPFSEKLPYNFSRGGHRDKAFQITQWYPKPAVYDQEGWHEMPYLDQGEFYGEFGRYDVRITLPKQYIVAATGQQQADKQQSAQPSQQRSCTLHFIQDSVHDFAWFADKTFRVEHDTLALPSGRIIDLFSYYRNVPGTKWTKSIAYMKRAILFRSALIGEYPFNVVKAAEVPMGSEGGMEYPTITGITTQHSAKDLDIIIEHELGHNWFYGILATNERRYPWMDEGINTYYDNRYEALYYPKGRPPVALAASSRQGTSHSKPNPKNPSDNKPDRKNPSDKDLLEIKLPDDFDKLLIDNLAKQRLDQPISTSSDLFNATNYEAIAYQKTALWMRQLEDSLGTPLFDRCMQEYFRQWQFRHPSPADFRQVMETTASRDLSAAFGLLDRPGPVDPHPRPKKIRPAFLFSTHDADHINYINFLPAVGYNKYDQFMVGALIHNYGLPTTNFRFFLAPLYATNSHQLNGIGGISYSWYHAPSATFRKVELALTGSRFSTLSGLDSNGNKLFGGFYKIVPTVRIYLKRPDPRSTLERWAEWKTYLIGENALGNYVRKTTDSNYYPTAGKYTFRYLNQLSLNIEDRRVLYPYKAQLQFQQAAQFYRINLTTNYYYNYAGGGGLDLRFFAAKFGYLGGAGSNSYDLTRFQPKLTAVRGNEDYTYSNYFVGRNEFTGLASQQIMMRDGGLPIRTDLFQGLQGRSDNWIASLNLSSDLPHAIVPSWIPLRVFLAVGTYAEGWQENPPTSKFLYVGGLELSLAKGLFHIYAPIVYSSDFSNQLKTVADQNKFFKKVSFSLDLQDFRFSKVLGNIPL